MAGCDGDNRAVDIASNLTTTSGDVKVGCAFTGSLLESIEPIQLSKDITRSEAGLRRWLDFVDVYINLTAPECKTSKYFSLQFAA